MPNKEDIFPEVPWYNNELSWFKSYLTNRSQAVNVHVNYNVNSSEGQTNHCALYKAMGKYQTCHENYHKV